MGDEGWQALQPASGDNPPETVRLRMLWEYAQTILSERQLRAFQLSRAGYSESEIGKELGSTEEAAKQLIKQARRKLRRIFDLSSG